VEEEAMTAFYKELELDGIHGRENVQNVMYVDQSSIGKTPRSCPATFI
jgi:excinuclease UvrABC ATPase subunit